MATSRQPAVPVPESVITMGATLELARSRHADHPQPGLTPSLIENTGARTRHLVQPVEETLAHPGFEERNRLYAAEAKARVPMVVRRALEDAGLRSADIDLIIHVSCTGFMMPPLTAWPSNTMGFPSATRQSPIAQLGCAGGGAAINRAHDLCRAYPAANALIMACELCLGVPPEALRFSRAALTEYGIVASVVVPDALRCLSDEGGAVDQARGLLAGSGPGSTAAQQVTFKVTGEQSRTASSCEVAVAPGFDIGAHVHTRGEELRYVREGEADVLAFEPRVRTPDGWRGWRSTQGDRVVRATPGTVSEVPPGCPYAFALPTEGPRRGCSSTHPRRRTASRISRSSWTSCPRTDPPTTPPPRRRSGIEQLTPLRHDRPARSH